MAGTLAVAFFSLPIAIVRAGSSYYTVAILTFIRFTLKASFMIDYNLRRPELALFRTKVLAVKIVP